MELDISCSTWIKEDDEKVLALLQKSDRWLTVEELVDATGLSSRQVQHTLRMLMRQMKSRKNRNEFLNI